jgi:CBS domain containing-hemolysin-like protein
MMNVVLIFLLILMSALFSGFETGGYLLNRIRLRMNARKKQSSAKRLQRVLSDAHLFIFTVLIGNNIAVYLLSRNVTEIFLETGLSDRAQLIFGIFPWNAEAAATLTLTLPLFFLGEVLPKNLFRRFSDQLMYRCSGLLYFSWLLFKPLTHALRFVFSRLVRGSGERDGFSGFSLSVEGLRHGVSRAVGSGELSRQQHGMVEKLVDMKGRSVRERMQPIRSIISVPENNTVAGTLEVMRSKSVEQVAVYRGSAGTLIGYVTIFDLLGPNVPSDSLVENLVREFIQLSPSFSLSQAFRRLRKAPSVPGIVQNAGSQAVGLIHLRDIAEYIVSSD